MRWFYLAWAGGRARRADADSVERLVWRRTDPIDPLSTMLDGNEAVGPDREAPSERYR